jgi:hypothetical protein
MKSRHPLLRLLTAYWKIVALLALPIIPTVLCIVLIGCDHPSNKAARIRQVKREIARAGGETNLMAESRTLFARCSKMDWSFPFVGPENSCFAGLAGVTNLGDVFYYHPDHIEIRIHNSHSDTYFIALLNPDTKEPAGFEKIAGNIGFIDPAASGSGH